MTMETIRTAAVVGLGEESNSSALAWSAIVAGALAAVAASLVLLALGSGMGFATMSPWGGGPSAVALGTSAAIWMVVTQWLASALGGYLAGRLRSSWVGVHSHEVTFRDSAHGVLAWALASVLVAALLTGAFSAVLGAGTHLAASGAASVAAEPLGAPASYLTDSLFRADHPATVAPETREEAGRILLTGAEPGGISDPDKTYLAQIIATTTGLSQADAAKRVDEVTGQIKAHADAARKAASFGAFMTALSLVVGAFIAGVAGALGGLRRDHYSTQEG